MMETIGFLGCGNMGGAIARAVCKAADPKKVYLANRTTAKAQALAKELGCKVATNAEVAAECDLIFLAVKPQMMEALLAPLKFSLDGQSLLFSNLPCRHRRLRADKAFRSFPSDATDKHPDWMVSHSQYLSFQLYLS